MALESEPRPVSNGASIQGIFLNIKRFFGDSDTLIALVLLCVSMCSFILGRVSVLGTGAFDMSQNNAEIISSIDESITLKSQEPPLIESSERVSATTAEIPIVASSGQYVGSKNGTKYHLPWCAGAQQIKEENKVWFSSKKEAEGAGYTPAANCKGI